MEIIAQVPINGFCSYTRIPSDENSDKIFSLNFNGDSYSDILLVNSGTRDLTLYSGDFGKTLVQSRKIKFSSEISSIQYLRQERIYVYTSRKQRLIGIAEINSSGKMRPLDAVKVESYPENISVSDVDKDGKSEILISGSSFEGLSLFHIEKNKLIKQQLFNKKLFSFAIFVDLNNDTYPDIAAVDLINDKMEFFYNNSLAQFSKVKEFKFLENITSLQSYDINLDGYQDVIMSKQNNIHVILGDSVSSFKGRLNIYTEHFPNKLTIADFNRDGRNDIAYLSLKDTEINVIYAKESNGFYPEITYLKKNNLKDIIPFYSRFIRGFLAYSSDGNFYLIDKVKVLKDSTSISLCSSPSLISYFDEGNNKISDLLFIDKEKSRLNLLLRDNAGIPSKYYSIQTVGEFTDVLVDDLDQHNKAFYCYSRGKRLIEIVFVDFKNDKVIKEKIYSSGNINDVKIKRDNEERARIFIVFNKSGELGFSIYEYKNFRYIVTLSKGIARNVLDAQLALEDPLSIFYWEKGKNSFLFNKVVLNNELKPENYITKYSMPDDDNSKIITQVGDIYNKEKQQAISFIYGKKRNIAVLTTDGESKIINLKKSLPNLRIRSRSDVAFGKLRFNGINRLFAYNSSDKAVENLEIVGKKGYIFSTKMQECKNLGSYFIKDLNFRNFHLVYINNKENCITINELK